MNLPTHDHGWYIRFHAAQRKGLLACHDCGTGIPKRESTRGETLCATCRLPAAMAGFDAVMRDIKCRSVHDDPTCRSRLDRATS